MGGVSPQLCTSQGRALPALTLPLTLTPRGVPVPPAPLSAAPPGPHFVAVNNKNEIVVTDFHNHSVKVSCAHPRVLQ